MIVPVPGPLTHGPLTHGPLTHGPRLMAPDSVLLKTVSLNNIRVLPYQDLAFLSRIRGRIIFKTLALNFLENIGNLG